MRNGCGSTPHFTSPDAPPKFYLDGHGPHKDTAQMHTFFPPLFRLERRPHREPFTHGPPALGHPWPTIQCARDHTGLRALGGRAGDGGGFPSVDIIINA